MINHYYKISIFFLFFIHFVVAQVPPTANDDTNTTFRNVSLNVASPGVLENDTDADNDVLTVTEFLINGSTFNVGQTASFAEGSITIFADGSYNYAPTVDYTGDVSIINYTITDGTFTSSANLNISVVLSPNPPIANDNNSSTFQNTPLNIVSPGVLDNDTDPDNDVLTVTDFIINGATFSAGQTANFAEGSITISADGSYTFTPTPNFLGNVPIITYTITDGSFRVSANLNITVLLPPEPPVARDLYDTADVNTILNVPAPGVMANDTDANTEDTVTVTVFTINGISYNAGETANFVEGSISIAANGNYVFTPTPDYIGEVPVINYTITDGTFTSSANLFLTVEPTEDLLEITSFESCNQGFNANGEYKVVYSIIVRNRSNAKDFHEPSLVRNIDLINNLQNTFGNGCIVEVDQMSIRNDNFIINYVDMPYPMEFTDSAVNPGFLDATSNSVFNSQAIQDLTLYPRQSIFVSYCVTIRPFCDGRPNPTPSGSGIDLTNTINITSDKGNTSSSLLLSDFHTTESVVTAGFYVPEFNDNLNPPGTVNPNGTYDYKNTVIITNEGPSTANNVNYNMGLGTFADNGVAFDELLVSQVSGPNITVNPDYDGLTNTTLLLPNNSLPAGETIILEVFYLIAPISSTNYSYFLQPSPSQTQGVLDGFNDMTPSNRRFFSFVTWSDNLGDHIDRYYTANSATAPISSDLYCNCDDVGMRFLFTSSSSTSKIISDRNEVPNGILEQEEITFQITIENTSESVQLNNLQLQDNLANICSGNIVSVGTPFIESSTATTNPVLNPSFNGTSDINFFNGTSGLLMNSETITIQFSVVFSETCTGLNTATFSSRNPLNGSVRSSNSVNVSAFTDTDNDGIPNSIDLDDDNDTIPDILESNGLNPLDDDDADFIPNYRDTDFGADANGDGIVDIFDFDSDGVANHFDLDSDNDGILDILEAGNISADTNNNGRTNNAVGANGLDNNLENDDSSNTAINYTIPNTDNNGNPNYLDIDADGDGIVDNIEAQLTANYITLNGVVSADGINTAYPNGLIPIDSENDNIADYIDTNSDDDIRDDVIEGWDTNSDGTPETVPLNIDADNDGLDDAFDNNTNLVNPTNGQTPLSFPNSDNADTPERDWREIIALVVLLDNVSTTEGDDLVFTFSVVTKNDNTILITSASPIDFSLSTINGTNTTGLYDAATSPFDFLGFTNLSFTIPPFTNTAQFAVTSLEDPIFELTELFTLNATVTSNNTLNSAVNGIGTILDNDDAPSITMNNSREDEGVDLVHTIMISNPSSTPILIDVNTSDDLAISPEDYTAVSETLTINGTVDPNNSNTQISFSITSLLDNLNELDEETLNVTGVVTSTNVGLQDLSKTATIVDVDPNPLVSIEDVTVEEGNTMLFTIRLLNANLDPMQNYLPINIILETIDETTTANVDYESIRILTNIPALTSEISQSIKTIDDRINEDTETFLFRATTNLGNVSNTVIPSAIGTIKDDDYPNLFSPNGDGRSDVFKIGGIEEFPNFKLVIFNRQGNEVYNYSNNGRTNPLWWDGTYNGNPVPVGVYYYTLDFNDGVTKPRTNFIQLIR